MSVWLMAGTLTVMIGCSTALDLRPLHNEPDAGRGGADAAGEGQGTDAQPNSGTPQGTRGTVVPANCAGSGLVGYYSFDDDTTDISGNGHDIVATAVIRVPGVVNSAYSFNGGESSMVLTSTHTEMDPADALTGDRTLCAWVNPRRMSGLAQPVFAGGVGEGDVFSLTSWTPQESCMGTIEGQPLIEHVDLGCVLAAGLTVEDGGWSFVCYVLEGPSSTTFFVNGAAVTQPGMNDYGYPLTEVSVGNASMVGGTTSGTAFDGAIDEVSIWRRALTIDELNALMHFDFPCSTATPSCAAPAICSP